MNPEMIAALRELEREKGVAFETILQGLEEAMAAAYKTAWKQEHPDADDDFVGFRAEIDPENGDMRMFQQELEEIDTEDGEGVEMKVLSEQEVAVTEDFRGRIGAQTAKQVIFQKLRDAEREMTYEEFAGREGDVVTGIVQQSERRYTLLDLGKVEALLPQAEQVPSEPYRNGERLKAFITEVRRGVKGPQIVVSRTHPGLLKRLFEMEVPEIEDGVVEIRGVAREPGHRSKMAVWSNEPAVDPVGACVGPEGLARAQRRHRAPRREDRRGALVRRRRRARRERVAAGEGDACDHRPRLPDGPGDRPGLPAVARDRERRTERQARSASHGLADRHQVGVPGGRRPGGARGGVTGAARARPAAHVRRLPRARATTGAAADRPFDRRVGRRRSGGRPTWPRRVRAPDGRVHRGGGPARGRSGVADGHRC